MAAGDEDDAGGAAWRIRAKQYLAGEYSPSGYTHAALCPPYGQPSRESLVAVEADDGNRPGCACGEDYGGRPCVAGTLFGTQYEMRVETGNMDLATHFGYDTLVELVGRLVPLRGGTRAYARAAYLSRWPTAKHNYRGPSSLFGFKWNFGVPKARSRWRAAGQGPAVGARAGGADDPPARLVMGDFPYEMDSVGVIEDDGGKLKEVLVLYRSASNHCHMWLRLLRTRSTSFSAGRFPLHSGYPRARTVRVGAPPGSGALHQMHMACVSEAIGPWEAGWRAQRRPGFVVLLQASPSVAASKSSFTALARSLVCRQLDVDHRELVS